MSFKSFACNVLDPVEWPSYAPVIWNPRTPHLGNVRGIHFIRMWKSVIYPATRAKQYGDFPCPRGIDLAL